MKASRRIRSVQRSPTTSSARATEQSWPVYSRGSTGQRPRAGTRIAATMCWTSVSRSVRRAAGAGAPPRAGRRCARGRVSTTSPTTWMRVAAPQRAPAQLLHAERPISPTLDGRTVVVPEAHRERGRVPPARHVLAEHRGGRRLRLGVEVLRVVLRRERDDLVRRHLHPGRGEGLPDGEVLEVRGSRPPRYATRGSGTRGLRRPRPARGSAGRVRHPEQRARCSSPANRWTVVGVVPSPSARAATTSRLLGVRCVTR